MKLSIYTPVICQMSHTCGISLLCFRQYLFFTAQLYFCYLNFPPKVKIFCLKLARWQSGQQAVKRRQDVISFDYCSECQNYWRCQFWPQIIRHGSRNQLRKAEKPISKLLSFCPFSLAAVHRLNSSSRPISVPLG